MPPDWLCVQVADRFHGWPWDVARVRDERADEWGYWLSLLAREASVLAELRDVPADAIEI